MPSPDNHYPRVLAIYPMWKGVAFAVLESRTNLLDWGVAKLYSKDDEEFLQRVEGLIDRYAVDALVLEDMEGSRRRAVARRRVQRAVSYAERRSLGPVCVKWSDVQAYFRRDAPRDIALLLIEAFPQLGPSLPPVRRLWESEDGRPSLFKAVAMAVLGSHEAA